MGRSAVPALCEANGSDQTFLLLSAENRAGNMHWQPLSAQPAHLSQIRTYLSRAPCTQWKWLPRQSNPIYTVRLHQSRKKKEMTYSISRTVSKRGGRKEELNVCYVLVLQTNTKDQMRTIRRNACLVYSLGLRVHSDTAELHGYPKQKMCYC